MLHIKQLHALVRFHQHHLQTREHLDTFHETEEYLKDVLLYHIAMNTFTMEQNQELAKALSGLPKYDKKY